MGRNWPNHGLNWRKLKFNGVHKSKTKDQDENDSKF
jgi:hypothetical protein